MNHTKGAEMSDLTKRAETDAEVSWVLREANRLIREGGTPAEVEAFTARKAAVLAKIEDA